MIKLLWKKTPSKKGTKPVLKEISAAHFLHLLPTLFCLRTNMQRHETHRTDKDWIHENVPPITIPALNTRLCK